MKNKTKKAVKYTEGPIKKIKPVADFLPSPEQLVFKEDTVKVTIKLSQSSINFFKHEAEKNHTHYQTMIRNLLDVYTAQYQ